MLPISFFEKAGNAYYNSIAIVDADGSVLGVYRKVKKTRFYVPIRRTIRVVCDV